MATASQEIFNAGPNQAVVTVTFDNVTGAISQLSWTVASGTLTVIVKRTGQADIVLTKTADGSQNVPAGYALTQDRGGGWAWKGALQYSIGWKP